MGRLVHLEELAKGCGLAWYLENYRESKTVDAEFCLPDPAFPYECGIDPRQFGGGYDNAWKREVRKWVDETLPDIVIMSYLSLTYYYRPKNYDGYQIQHGYYRFHFESESSFMMFKLRFSEYIAPVMTKFRDDSISDGLENEVWIPPTLRPKEY